MVTQIEKKLICTKKVYIDKTTKEEKTFWLYEVVCSNGIRVPVRCPERTGQALLELDLESSK